MVSTLDLILVILVVEIASTTTTLGDFLASEDCTCGPWGRAI